MVILSLFDYSGNWSKPYKDNGFEVIQIDIKSGIDLFTWNYKQYKPGEIFGILAACPCTDFALSGAAWFYEKDRNGQTYESLALVYKTLAIIQYLQPKFWVIENPMSRIANLAPEIGNVNLKFNPCDFAGYSSEPEKNAYNKQTWLWGNFRKPQLKRVEPLQKEFPGHTNLGGKSERTKELRSITPDGFALAFYLANH